MHITPSNNYYQQICWNDIKGYLDSQFRITGHKYYYSCILQSHNADSDILLGISNFGGSGTHDGVRAKNTSSWQLLSVVTRTTPSNNYVGYTLLDKRGTLADIYVTNFLCIDLTEMFGADNEPDKDTCDRLFGTMDVLPQGLTIANPTEFKSIGFNHFNPDNVLEGKAIVDNAIVSGDKKIAVIPCLPCKVGTGENNGYCIHGEFGDDIKVYLTPLNPMEVDGELYMHELTKDATTDTYVPQIKGYMLVEVPTTANLCAHFLWSEDKCDRDSYEPYFESKVELPTIPQMSEWGLAGIKASDTMAQDTIDLDRRVYVKRVTEYDLGAKCLSRKSGKDNNVFYATQGDHKDWENSNISGCICNEYTYVTAKEIYENTNLDKVIFVGKSGYFNANYTSICIRDSRFTDATLLQEHLNGIKVYYVVEPKEYPLPKVDNSYISSDYGVEQFDSVVPCNANNLYYMRSLAGETRNFLDRLMAGLGVSDATVVADRILAVVNPAPANVEPETPIEV
jgi:hypothetical protein